MKPLIILLKKECIEYFRNYKLMIFGIVFLILAFLSPLAAKFITELLPLFLPKEVAESFPYPTAFDSWEQFFKNFSQIGLLLTVILFGAILASERQNGTLIVLITKGLPRWAVILSKGIFASTCWTIGYYLSFVIVFFYTKLLWPHDSVHSLSLSVFLLWAFGLFIIAAILLGNVLFRSFFSTLLWLVGIIVFFFIISLFPKLEKISLIRLATDNNSILHGIGNWSDYSPVLTLCFILICLFYSLAIVLFNRKVL